MKVGINGMGRIGRLALRAALGSAVGATRDQIDLARRGADAAIEDLPPLQPQPPCRQPLGAPAGAVGGAAGGGGAGGGRAPDHPPSFIASARA